MKLAFDLKRLLFRAFTGAIMFLILPVLFNAFSKMGFSLTEKHVSADRDGKTLWDAFAAACTACS